MYGNLWLDSVGGARLGVYSTLHKPETCRLQPMGPPPIYDTANSRRNGQHENASRDT